MKQRQFIVGVIVEVEDTGDDTFDKLQAIDAATSALEGTPAHVLIRETHRVSVIASTSQKRKKS